VQADTCRQFASSLVDASISDTLCAVSGGLPKGRYWWRVAVIGDSGGAGEYCDPDSFTLGPSAYPRNAVRTIPAGSSPNSCAITPDGRELWVDNSDSIDGHVYVISTEDLTVIHRISTFGFAHAELEIGRDGLYAYFCQRVSWPFWPECYGGIAKISTTLDSTVAVFGDGSMNGEILGPTGYGLSLSPSSDNVYAVDNNSPQLYGMAFRFDSCGGLCELNYIDGAFDIECAHHSPRCYVLSAQATMLELETARMNVLRTMYLPGAARLLCLSDDDRYGFVTRLMPPGFVVVDLESLTVAASCTLRREPLVEHMPFSLALSPDQRLLVFGDEGKSLVHIADVSNPLEPSLLESLTIGSGKIRDICFSPDGQRVYVSSNPDGIIVLER
jgi:DNA-binding beta-propeller fold protein YncE